MVETGLRNAPMVDLVAEKRQEHDTLSSVAVGEHPGDGGRGRGFQEYRTTGQAANVDDIRGLNSFVGTHFCCWWRGSNEGVGYGHEEMDALVENDTWEFVECPKNVVIDNHWVLGTKLNVDGLTKRIRARLVAKGHVQKVSNDYNETFRPVARYA